jgi:hypothetical protein
MDAVIDYTRAEAGIFVGNGVQKVTMGDFHNLNPALKVQAMGMTKQRVIPRLCKVRIADAMFVKRDSLANLGVGENEYHVLLQSRLNTLLEAQDDPMTVTECLTTLTVMDCSVDFQQNEFRGYKKQHVPMNQVTRTPHSYFMHRRKACFCAYQHVCGMSTTFWRAQSKFCGFAYRFLLLTHRNNPTDVMERNPF